MKLKNEIYITDQKKINIEKNNFFGKTTISYLNLKNKIEIYYDANSHILLGYKNEGKSNYKKIINSHNRLKINFSVKYKLINLGMDCMYPNIDILSKLKINKIGINRLENMKSILYHFVYIIINLYYVKENYFIEKKISSIEEIIKRYKKIIKNFNIEKIISNEKKKFINNWNLIEHGILINNINNDEIIKINKNEIYNKINFNSNLIIFYIINQFSLLLKMNENEFIKKNLIYLLIDFINNQFNFYYREQNINIFDIKRFKYILASEFLQETYKIDDVTDYYYNKFDPNLEDDKEQIKDLIYEDQSLDYEGEIDYEIDYEPKHD
jgi:hypothetical protein